MIQPEESWTHDFCLLSHTEPKQDSVTGSTSFIKRSRAWQEKGCFPKQKRGLPKFNDVLEREYDKLRSQDAAFELMRAETGGTSRPLKLSSIPMGTPFPMLRMLKETIP